MQLENAEQLIVDADAIDVVLPDRGEFVALHADDIGDGRDRLVRVRLQPRLGVQQGAEEFLHQRTVGVEIGPRHHDVEGLGIQTLGVEQHRVLAKRLPGVGDMRLPGIEGVDAAGRHRRQHFLRPQVDQRHVARRQARGLQQRRGVDLAAGARGEADLLAAQIGLGFDPGLCRRHGLEIGVFHAGDERDRLVGHRRGGHRRFGRGRKIGAAAEHGIQALLARGEVGDGDVEPLLFEHALRLGDDDEPDIGPRFCASRAFTRSCAAAIVGATIDQQSTAHAANAAAGMDLARGMSDLHGPPGVLAACSVTMMAPAPDRSHPQTPRPPFGPPGQPVGTVEVIPLFSEMRIVGHGPRPRKQLIDIGRGQARRDAGVLAHAGHEVGSSLDWIWLDWICGQAAGRNAARQHSRPRKGGGKGGESAAGSRLPTARAAARSATRLRRWQPSAGPTCARPS